MDFTSEGQFSEAPEAAANQAYMGIKPSFSEVVGATFEDSSPISYLERVAERGTQAGSSWFDQAFVQAAEANSGMVIDQPVKTPTITASEANARYAPAGATITDKPIPKGLAQIVGRQKQAQIDRESVMARYQDDHSWPVNFGTGLAAFMLDPLNDATMFVPGLGEDAILGGLGKTAIGTGLVGRTLARAGAGATAAAAGQVPLAALRYGLSPEEATDYGLRDAARDMAFGAAGGAVLGAGLGGVLHETGLLKPDTAMARAAEIQRPAGPIPSRDITNVDPVTNHAAISSAISQILEGRPVDVLPVFDAKDFESISNLAAMRAEHADLGNRIASLPEGSQEAATRLAQLETVERNLREEDLSAQDRGSLMTRRDEILTDTNPEALQAGAEPLVQRQRLTARQDRMGEEIQRLEQIRQSSAIDSALQRGPQPPVRFSPSQLAEAQAALYRDGYASGVNADDMAYAHEEIYGQKAQPAQPEQGGAPGSTSAASPQEADLADLENRWKAVADQAALTDQERGELAETQGAVKAAGDRGQGFGQASECVKEAGI